MLQATDKCHRAHLLPLPELTAADIQFGLQALMFTSSGQGGHPHGHVSAKELQLFSPSAELPGQTPTRRGFLGQDDF